MRLSYAINKRNKILIKKKKKKKVPWPLQIFGKFMRLTSNRSTFTNNDLLYGRVVLAIVYILKRKKYCEFIWTSIINCMGEAWL